MGRMNAPAVCRTALATSLLAAAALRAAAEPEAEAAPKACATALFGARLDLSGIAISPRSYDKTWIAAGPIATGAPHGSGSAGDPVVLPFALRAGSGDNAASLAGAGRFHVADSGAVAADWTVVAENDGSFAEAFIGATLPTADLAGGSVVLDGRELPIPRAKSKTGRLFENAVSRLAAKTPDGRVLFEATFEKPTRILVQDDRFYGNANVTLRFFLAIGRVEAGREYAVRGTFAVPASAPFALAVGEPVRIVAGEDWIPFRYDPWIEPGSALDFTGVVPHHEPAGAFGRVVARDGHFELEGRPGVPQRFFGVNVCGTANLPDTAEQAERFAANLARIGYNSLRLHHHEKWLVRADGKLPEGEEALARHDSTALDPALAEKFDLLVAACVRHGIYLTTDLYVSRAHVVPWRAIGVDRDGPVPADKYKLHCAFSEPAFSNLCAWSRNFLTHVNPYTGRSLAEEPALATLALINEGNLGNWGADALRDVPGVQEAWETWLASKAGEPAFDGIPATIPDALYAADGATSANRHATAFAIFLADREAALFARLRDFVRDDLGCRAPLSSLSAWYEPAQYALARRDFDYVDAHFYVDHPQFLGTPWRLPSSCANANPVLRPAAGAAGVLFKRQMDKPMCVTEFNYCGPGRFRGIGGIAAGAVGALQDWSGLWRFAWSHGRGGIVAPGGQMGYFDIAGDPLAIAAERAALCLFLRRDIEPLAAEAPVELSEATLRDPRHGAPQSSSIGDPDRVWEARLGVSFDGFRPTSPATECHQSPSIAIGKDGSFLLDTPCIAGGLAENGTHAAGPLRWELKPSGKSHVPVPTTVWATSLDGESIAASRHLLLTHLTDVQNSGIEYADEALTILLGWGKTPHLMRNGEVRVELTLEAKSESASPPVVVFRLDSAGRRLASIPSSFDSSTGRLDFTARTDYDPASATYLYEIVRE